MTTTGLGIATLIAWLTAGAAGLSMFGAWLRRAGVRQQRSRAGGMPPAVIVTHLSLGALGLVAWLGYLATSLDALAWTAVGLLMPGIGLGICTVTLWSPYPTPPRPGTPLPPGDTGPGGAGPATGMLATPAEHALAGQLSNDALAHALSSEALTGQLINEALAGLPARQQPARPGGASRRHLAPLIPAAHGLAAVVTFVLAVLTAISAR